MSKSAKATVPKDRRRREPPAPPKPEKEREGRGGDLEAAPVTSYAQSLQKIYSKRVDAIDKKMGLSVSLSKQPRLSTGLLSIDLMLGNGLVPGMSVFFGAEQSAKSTACMTTLRSSLGRTIPIRKYFDAEGAVDRRYTGNILGTDSFTDVFGDRDRAGRWIKPPMCLYHDDNITETVFRDMHRTAAMLPNKVYHQEIGEWFLVFDRTREQVELCKELVNAKTVEAPDKSLMRTTGHYWCSVGDDSSPQAVFFLDSLPSLIPEKVDEDEGGQGLAADARVLSMYLKRVRGKLRPKGAVLMCVNQLRDRPMPGPGQLPYYEPCGNAVRFCADARSMFTSRVPMDGFPRWKDNKGICIEESVEYPDSFDLYAFKGITNIKNKYGQPFRKTSARVWYKDGEGEPRGFDPVYDVYRFLDTLGAIEGFQPTTVTDNRKKFYINLKPIMDIEWTWPMFKALIIGHYDKNRRVLKTAHDLGAPVRFDLRAYCQKLLDSGKSEDMVAANNRRLEKRSSGVDLEADDDDKE